MNSRKLVLAFCAVMLASGCVTGQTSTLEVQEIDTYVALTQKLRSELNSDQAQIAQLHSELKVTMVNEILFADGEWMLSVAGERTLARIAPTLSTFRGQQIIVQGFTDDEPIDATLRSRFPSNLELSSARADDVARFLISKGVPQSSISAQGFGEARPVASNMTRRGRAHNRRVEILISAPARP